jgi:hypothetical protein
VEDSVGCTQTLATVIDRLYGALSVAPDVQDGFMAKVARLGWHEDLRHSEDLVKMEMRQTGPYFFEVNADFPRLPENFVLPSGVVKLEYIVDLSNVPILDWPDVVEAAKTM